MIPRLRGMRIIRFAAMAWALAVFCACGMGGSDTCGTEVPDHDDVAFGCVDRETGGPAVGVRVTAVPVPGGTSAGAKSAAGPVDSNYTREMVTEYTDRLGRFTFGGLRPGAYNFVFEDTLNPRLDTRSIQIRAGVRLPMSPGENPLSIRMGKPRLVTIQVKDLYANTPIAAAVCQIGFTPYVSSTGALGVAIFYLPVGYYQVSCTVPGETAEQFQRIQVDEDGAEASFSLFVKDSREGALSAPQNLAAKYDSITGIVSLSWSPVEHHQRRAYGLRRVDIGLGGGPKESEHQDTSAFDVAFKDTLDSVQVKHLLYNVYSLRSNIYEVGSRHVPLRIGRPWAMGPRIDSLFTLAPDISYRPGDTARIVAEWHNRIRGNDTLYWRVKGSGQTLAGTSRPSASGRDTLVFPVTEAGTVEIGITIRDAEGYRSWDSRSFRFGAP